MTTNTSKAPARVLAGQRAARTRKWRLAEKRAAKSAKVATTMTRVAITRVIEAGKRWFVLGFPGRGGRESQGIVDLLAIRKDHKTFDGVFKRCDLFEVV